MTHASVGFVPALVRSDGDPSPRFGEPKPTDSVRDTGLKVLFALLCCAIVALIAVHFDRLHLARQALLEAPFGLVLVLSGLVFLLINVAAFFWRLILFLQYRAMPDCSDEALPECTVIVPAFNEGAQVAKTLKSIAASAYPRRKLHIVAVDDGSEDDTWRWIKKSSVVLKGRIKAVRLPRNRGKRHALSEGIRYSRGEVLVTIDSDSEVSADTLRHLVAPFVRDARVGAVAGNVRVLNRQAGLIPRMLDVVFCFSFDFIRAGQSVVNTVMCTPGALSAYRRSLVLKVLQRWLDQTFFGKPANIGEDRAMTNLILEQGYHARYQQNAVVWTEVPTRHANLCKMYLRWARSNIRETLVMSRFVFRRFREDSARGARINLVLHLLALTKSQFLVLAAWACVVWHPVNYGLNMVLGVLIGSTIPAAFFLWRMRSSDAIWAYAYGFLWMLGLWWITPYALLTPQKTGWLTRRRNLKSKSFPHPFSTPGLGHRI